MTAFKKLQISEQVQCFRFGQPFNTEAIASEVTPVNAVESNGGEPEFWATTSDFDSVRLSRKLSDSDRIYGMGQSMGGLNKRGRKFSTWCSDDPSHTPEKEALYGSHPFLIVDGESTFGLFIDFPGEMFFDIGYTDREMLEIHIPSLDVDIYELTANNKKQLVRDFRSLIGKPYVPPRWGFGYQQCRWSYPDAASIDDIIDGFRSNDIPCDTVYMDIDYMVDYKDFTVDPEKFPDFTGWVKAKKQQGIRLIPIIDAGVRIEEGYDVYEEGLEKGYFCKDDNGDLFKAAVWPGLCAFPDFLKPEARQWWGKLYQRLTDQGIEGFWNDMNEPALFYTPAGIDKAIDTVASAKGKNVGIHEFFQLKDSIMNMSNSREDYRSFYHEPEPDVRVNHEQVHNLYGINMTRAAAEGFEQIDSDKRFLMFSRASSIGAHRYGGIWFGDNHSWWEHLKLNLQMLPGVNFSGFLYAGADMGGFGAHSSAELQVRWTQLGVFTPLMRNHAAMGTRQQEPFAFDEQAMDIMREHIKLRYRMVPYLYSEFMNAVDSDDAIFYPLSFEYSDERSAEVEDQLLVGSSLMCAPVYEQNARGRYVYLPEDMLLWKVKKHDEVNAEILAKGDHYLPVALEEMPVFIRKDAMLPLTESVNWLDERQPETLDVIVHLDKEAGYELRHDDGISKNLHSANTGTLLLKASLSDSEIDVFAENSGYECSWKTVRFHIYLGTGAVEERIVTL
ncbi:alpha-glucosidase [Endozoicomonas sp. OPT23]|uniref:glycoside hydrolase family 31 protein n=1 Tax=Endozoicomonas sp. OPT23 TaxID=2072845 RepID=UPI00129A6522|nr:TIM-barrel domain-containing protein [Endozoicomonas sp. OPT23]MRI32341.1 alpha-glucosidase [Endozoicomonas sp. OPT23]